MSRMKVSNILRKGTTLLNTPNLLRIHSLFESVVKGFSILQHELTLVLRSKKYIPHLVISKFATCLICFEHSFEHSLSFSKSFNFVTLRVTSFLISSFSTLFRWSFGQVFPSYTSSNVSSSIITFSSMFSFDVRWQSF